MNNAPRRPLGPVRQHSLQQPPPRHQPPIRRQRSTDDDKGLSIYSSTAATRNRFSNNPTKGEHSHYHTSKLDRPKVRVVWDDQSMKQKSDERVEIVARQIPTGKPSRPVTGRGGRGFISRCPLAEKATILYSRQELAERLRLAWKQREENKANIDIFLAHNTTEERCDSSLSTATNQTAVSTPKMQRKFEDPHKSLVKTDSEKHNETSEDGTKLARQIPHRLEGCKYQTWFTSLESSGTIPKDQTVDDSNGVDDEKRDGETKEDEGKEEDTISGKKPSININCNEWNAAVSRNSKTENTAEVKSPVQTQSREPDYSLAKLKRASYQSGLNKAFNVPQAEKTQGPRNVCRPNGTPQESPRIRRTSSAPPQRRTQVSIIIDAPSAAPEDTEPERRAMSATEAKSPVTISSRPIKSAPPVKRRTKPSKKRSLSSMGYSKDDFMEDAKGAKGKSSKGSKSPLETKPADVVTMVSLISSADSESEMDENSPRDDKLICELRSKLPTTPIIKSSNGLNPGARKPFKSVSFQQDSFDYDTSDPEPPPRAALQARFLALSGRMASASPDTEPLQLGYLRARDVSSEAPPPTDREKRCLAVPIGDVLDKKRKLIRCRSAVIASRLSDAEKQSSDSSQTSLQAEMGMSQTSSETSVSLQNTNPLKIITSPSTPKTEADLEEGKNVSVEHYCQTPKEKECWHLYKRMCDKGVFVSFDTVLRGMLTPTEYRLRQKELSQNC